MSGSMLNVAGAASRLNVSEKTIYRALREGRLPGSKLLGCWRIDPDELERWIRSEHPVERSAVREEGFEARVYELRRAS